MAAIASIAGEQLKAALGSAGKKSKGNDRGIFAHDDMMTGGVKFLFIFGSYKFLSHFDHHS